MKALVFASLLTFLVSGVGFAQGGRPVDIENQGSWETDDVIVMVNTPMGHGTTFDYCYLETSHDLVTDNITVEMTFADEWPGPVHAIQNYAWYLEFSGASNIYSCYGWEDDTIRIYSPFANTTSNDGIYIIDRSLVLGGNGYMSGKLVYSNGLGEYTFGSIYFLSPDINGDGTVSLADNTLFTQLYNSGSYHKQIDFAYDGVIGLGDLTVFATAYGESCP